MDRFYGSRLHGWLLIHGGLATMRRHGHSVAWEVVVIAQRERGEVVGVLTIGASWSQSYSDSHTTTLNRVVRWCFDREMVLGVRMID
jgi:hypothetical protein